MDLSVIKKFNIEILDSLDDFFYIKNKKNIIPYHFVKKHHLLPLQEEDGKIKVASLNPFDLSSIKELELLLEKKIIIAYAPSDLLEKAIERCYFHKRKEQAEEKTIKKAKGYDLLDASENILINLLNNIILEAIQQRASDIHFETMEDGLNLRYRIDGLLQKRASPNVQYHLQLLTRIKVLAKLDIAEHRRPQDGRMKLTIGQREIDFRVSTIPTVNGERIVLRILDRGNIVLGLQHLGMNISVREKMEHLLSLPEGIILVTGPTGSGKTTTLYSAIHFLNSSEKNIMTIEDPVEYKLENVAQINVNPKINLTFASGLRHILRQDPDSVMVGEIRDRETAEVAIQSSLTGHLVLSTLHTNDAPSAITRLSDMGIELYLLSSSVIGIIAQRLVRKICPKCITSYQPSFQQMEELGISQDHKLYKGEGCSYCFHTGYFGRHGIYEVMMIGKEIRKQILKGADAESIKEVALKEGMEALKENGIRLVKDGVTTIQEVLRVSKKWSI